MNRVLEKVFPSFKPHAKPRSYYSYPEGSTQASFVFKVQYVGPEAIADARVVLFLAPAAHPEPRFEIFELEDLRPLFAKDVQNVQPGDVIEFESSEFSLPNALSFVPADLSNFKSELFVQALINKNTSDPDANSCAGNLYSTPTQVHFTATPGTQSVVSITADQVVVDDTDLTDTEWIEHISLKSELLSAYHNQDVYMTASIVLPKGYNKHQSSTQEEGVFPTVYYIEGFTGTEAYASRAKAFLESEMGDDWKAGNWPTPMFRVTLGSRFKFGHTSFADSEVNGPWGTALVQEFIPYFESKYKSAVSASRGRFLHGHSSGGWSTLWLQLQFPDFFGGTWSTAPDPVDFSHFQIVNIYEAANMFWDSCGHPIPSYRCDGHMICSIRDENQIERVLTRGNGGQWDAFCAVFSQRDPLTGMPVPLFDKLTGEVNTSVVKHWAKYDICKFLRERPALLASDALRGKVHVICGVEDNYYLNGACQALQKIVGAPAPLNGAVAEAGVPNYVAMVAGDHTTIRNRAHYKQIYDEIARMFANNSQ